MKSSLVKHPRPSRIFLTGPMGAGKSTVGAVLAQRLCWQFFDTDTWVEQKASMPISLIFERGGEPAFRALENQAIQQACELAQAVIALGGGALMSFDNLEHVRSAGPSVWLDCGVDALAARLAPSLPSRPLLAGLPSDALLNRLVELIALRAPGYAKAELRVQTDGLTPTDIAEQIVHQLFPEKEAAHGG
jgi:shikimate kinase